MGFAIAAPYSPPATMAGLTIAETEVFSGNSPGVAAWTDLDLSSVVGANEALVLLKFATSGITNGSIAFRRNGDSDEAYLAGGEMGCAGSENSAQNLFYRFWVETDTNGVVEWKFEGTTKACTIDVEAYIKLA